MCRVHQVNSPVISEKLSPASGKCFKSSLNINSSHLLRHIHKNCKKHFSFIMSLFLSLSLSACPTICLNETTWIPPGRSLFQIQRSRFESWRYQIFWEVVALEWGPLSLMSAIEELLERKCSGSSLEIREYGCRDLLRWPCNIPLLAKVGTNIAKERRLLSQYSSLAD
jgi:hypothetical protein